MMTALYDNNNTKETVVARTTYPATTTTHPQRRFHRFMDEMTVEEIGTIPVDRDTGHIVDGGPGTDYYIPNWGPTTRLVQLRDRKGRMYIVPQETLQRQSTPKPEPETPPEPRDGSYRVSTKGIVFQRRDDRIWNSDGDPAMLRRWFTPGSAAGYTWTEIVDIYLPRQRNQKLR